MARSNTHVKHNRSSKSGRITLTLYYYLIIHYYLTIHGLSEEIVSVNGPPASNGEEAEWAARTFNQGMKAAKHEPGTLSQKICSFLLSYCTRLHTATRCTLAELLMNRRLRTRLVLLHRDIRKKWSKPSKLQPTTPKRQLSVGDPVFLQDYRKSQDPWVKGVIVAKLGPVTYRIHVKEFFWKRQIDQLKEPSCRNKDSTPVVGTTWGLWSACTPVCCSILATHLISETLPITWQKTA